MTKTQIKNAPNNKLIVELADCFAVIVASNGVRCKGFDEKMNNVARELLNRGLLEESDIEYLNK
jgi:hypothetical protein